MVSLELCIGTGNITHILVGNTLADYSGQLGRKVFIQDLGTFGQKSIEAKDRGVRERTAENTVPKSKLVFTSTGDR